MKVVDFIFSWVVLSGGRMIEKSCYGMAGGAEFTAEPLLMTYRGESIPPSQLTITPVYEENT